MTGERPLTPSTTRGEAVRILAARFASAGIEAPQREARILAAAILGLSPADLVLSPDAPLGPEAATLDRATTRRAVREPFHRIIGTREFYGLDLALSPGTLVPRPDTEALVDAVLDHLRAEGRDTAPLSVLDLGTGSGAILIALIANLPQATGTGTDLSADALATAAANAARCIGPGRTRFRQSDWFAEVDGRYDVIVSNPPYIVSSEIAALEPEVARHDPLSALDGGADGLDAYRALAQGAQAHLASGGLIGLELGAGQRGAVTALFEEQGLSVLACRHDLSGIERALLFRRA